MKNFITDAFKRTITKDQSKDTGIAMVLLLLLVSGSFRHQALVAAAMITLVVTMVYPQIYRPIAVVWLGGTHLLGTVVSKILLTIVFFGVVTPIGLVRRFMGIDSLHLKAFKSGDNSVMVIRNHTFIGQDIEKPY
jgi:hypothetical protein